MAFISEFKAQARSVPFWGVMTVVVFSTAPAHAYIDPGAGSMFLQLLVAAVAGGLWTLKVYWRRLKEFFTPGRPAKNGDDPPNRDV